MKWILTSRTPRLAALLAALLLVGFWQQATPAHAAASLTLTSSVVPEGTGLKVTGSGFTPNDTVSLYYDASVNDKSQRIGKAVKADAQGSFTTGLRVPQGTLPISYKLLAVDSHQVASGQNFTVRAALTIRPDGSSPETTVVAGHNVLVNVKGFGAKEALRIQSTFPNYSGIETASTRNVTANVKGNFSGSTFAVPFGTKVGWISLSAVGLKNNKTAQGRIYVTYRPSIAVHSATVAAGRWANISGKGFAPGDQIQVQIPIGTKTGAQQILTLNVTANANGYFSKSVHIPSSTSAGNYVITVTSTDTGLKRTTKLNVYLVG